MRFKVNFIGDCVDVRMSKSNKPYSIVNDVDNLQYVNLFNIDTLKVGQRYEIEGTVNGDFLSVSSVKEVNKQ